MSAADTATSQAIEASKASTHVIDAAGRSITLARPSVLAQFRLVETVGGNAAGNQVYMGMVLPLIFVSAIDGDPVRLPATKLELEALIQRLGDAGIEAVQQGVVQHFGSQRSPDEERAAVKP